VQADGDHGDYSFARQASSSGLVLGRKTYEGLAGYWPGQSGKWADMVNPMPKYVGSNSLCGDLEWNATLLERNLEDSIPKLKDEVGGALVHARSGEFAYALAEKGLIDEYEVYLNPPVWGEGNVDVLGDRGTVRMELADVKRFDSGVVLSPTSQRLDRGWGREAPVVCVGRLDGRVVRPATALPHRSRRSSGRRVAPAAPSRREQHSAVWPRGPLLCTGYEQSARRCCLSTDAGAAPAPIRAPLDPCSSRRTGSDGP
jgi:dihydrofolate reductase